jgi:chemotaxis protein MotB
MSSPGHGRRRGDRHEEHDAGMERWLLTYADMITLLLALFIVLWSISSVNISKFTQLKASLSQALNGKVIPGSSALLSGGSQVLSPQGTQVPTPNPSSSLDISASIATKIVAALQQRETESLKSVQRQVNQYAKQNGLAGKLRTSIDEQGLEIRVLTDDLLFDPGQATLKARAIPILYHVAQSLNAGHLTNPIRIEGNTDSTPISTPQFRSNWELSTARADAVLEFMLTAGIAPTRLSVAGFADTRPLASNATAAGRALNRRVQLVVLRQQQKVTP